MSWIRKSPFKYQEDAVTHMVDLLGAEARNVGSPLSDEELDILSRECPLSDDLADKAKRLIGQSLAKEYLQTEAAGSENPKSLSASLEWAEDNQYPNIARLTEEVVLEGRASGILPSRRSHGWGLVKDKLWLVGCGLLVVLAIFVIGAILSWK
jgi:hypothetical protein